MPAPLANIKEGKNEEENKEEEEEIQDTTGRNDDQESDGEGIQDYYEDFQTAPKAEQEPLEVNDDDIDFDYS